MNRIQIPIDKFITKPHTLFDEQWFLLSCGDYEKKEFNSMTISWGSLGTMWDLPFALVVVRFSRYTFQFMEKYDTFTLCAFPEQYRDILNILGSRSGRNIDKIHPAGISPTSSQIVKAPSFKEAELALECRKIYWNDMNPAHFLDERILIKYKSRDYHRIYFGELLGIYGIQEYIS